MIGSSQKGKVWKKKESRKSWRRAEAKTEWFENIMGYRKDPKKGGKKR